MLFKNNSEKEPPSDTVFLPWTALDRIGIRQFDEEHRELVNLINQFHEAMVLRRNRVIADEIFEKLIQATRNHFSNEEALLGERGFPERDSHAKQHSDLLVEIRSLHRQFKEGSLSAMMLLTYLKNWLIHHIKESDRQYAVWLKTRGLA